MIDGYQLVWGLFYGSLSDEELEEMFDFGEEDD